MRNRSWALPVVWLLLCLGFLGTSWGCSKRAVSSSGDQTTVASTPAPAPPVEAPPPPVETIKPEPMVTIPEKKPAPPAPVETAREPLATPPQPLVSSEPPAASPSEPVPSQPAPPPAPAATDDLGLADIHFDYDRYAIRNDAQPVLLANADWIKSHPGKSIVIEGHCDERGTLAYNLVLGEKRARAAKRYLEDLGVSASRLKIVSYGEVRPICKDYEESCWQRNRRAHFVPQ